MNLQATAPSGQNAQEFPHLSFQVGQNRCCVSTQFVSSIMLMPEKAENFPDAPSYCKGFIHVRGQIIPLIDMRSLFSMYDMDFEAGGVNSIVVVIEGEQGVLGLIVDQVHSVETVVPLDPEQNSFFFAKSRYVNGIGHSDKLGQSILMLNTEALLALCDGLQF